MFTLSIRYKELYEHTRVLPIPRAIEDHNYYMNKVDIANQLQDRFSTQQRGVKPWRPLFYSLLDTTIINDFCISKYQRKAKLGSTKYKVLNEHQAFWESLE